MDVGGGGAGKVTCKSKYYGNSFFMVVIVVLCRYRDQMSQWQQDHPVLSLQAGEVCRVSESHWSGLPPHAVQRYCKYGQ